MIITLRIQNSLERAVMVRTMVASEQPCEAGQALEMTFDFTTDMGALEVVIEPTEAGVRERP